MGDSSAAIGSGAASETTAAGTQANTAVIADDEQATTLPGTGKDAASRARRRAWRARSNDRAARTLVIGTIATLVGGSFWGFSGTAASFLFDHYHVDTAWLMSVRQLFAGLLFIAVALAFDRQRLIKLWTSRADRRSLLLFAAFGLLFNQFFYLLTVRITNAGTATVMQCLNLLLIMAFSCVRGHRRPRKRELAGVALALTGTFLLATGGDPSKLSIPPLGLATGALTAIGAAFMSILPARILPRYGSNIVTGSAMLASGTVCSLVVQPWRNAPALDANGVVALAVLVVVGSFLAYLLYMQGVKDVGSMRAGLLGTVEPISATLTSAVMLGTVFAPTDLAGFALIIGMVFLTI